MRKLLTILLVFLASVATGQTFTFTPIPLSTDFVRPGAGFELWNDQNGPFGTMNIPIDGAPQRPLDAYFRFSMNDFFANPTVAGDSTMIFTRFDQKVNAAKANGQVFSFRIMSVCNNCDVGNNTLVSYNGGQNSYPKFLHDLMQAEAVDDWLCTAGDQTQWIPNWNSAQYHRWVGKLCAAIKAHIGSTSATGTPFANIVRLYDLGFYGAYSEQHSAGILRNGETTANYPAGTFGTAASLIAIANAQTTALRPMLFTIPFNAYDAIWLNNTNNPVAYGQWLLDSPDSIGLRLDHLSDDQNYDHDYLERNFRMGASYNSKLMNRWRFSPIRGEPPGYPGQPTNLSYLPSQVVTYHINSFGNGNYATYNNSNTTAGNNARSAARLAGFRLRLTGGDVVTSGNIRINLNWLNEGVTPTYEDWTVQYLIKNGAGTTVSTLTSSFNPKRFLPSGSPQTRTDIFALPGIPSGTYSLWVVVRDPLAYRLPMPLAITGRQSDGSYFLANINLAAGGNQNPVANAGPNQSISGTSTTLTSTGSSDPDGTITTFAWSRVSGPNTPTIVTPAGATTSVTGMIAGTYVFNLTVTDNLGATGSDQVQVIVNPNSPPVANAGPNQSITLPTSSVTVNGSGSTDNIAISTYTWNKISGPNNFTITNPNSVSTTITGLTAGVYVFRLTVADGGGLTDDDDIQISVGSGNQPPVSNAGPNITRTLPIASGSLILDGSNSSDDAPGYTFLWTQVGGPQTATILAPTNVGTVINGITVAGLYIFRLRVTDVEGLTNTDDIQVTVNAAPNGTPVANAGANQTITLPTNSVTVSSAASTDDVGIVSRLWTRQSGPTTFTIVNPTSVSTAINNLIVGVYEFRVTVTDGGGLTSFDDVQITVLPLPNTAPNADAGGNQTITLPTNSVSVSGSGSTDNVGITSYLWTKISGPATFTISTPNSVNTNIINLVEGTYIFRLTVGDVGGLTDTDDMQVTVLPAVVNNAPTAVAGPPQTITLPTSSVTLNGSSSTDDVGIVSYLWTKISGPASYSIATPTTVSTSVTNLTEGIYFFQLTVTDGGGLTDTDEVIITVNPAPTPPRPGQAGHSLFKTGVKFLPRQ